MAGLEALAKTLGTTEAGARRWGKEVEHDIRILTVCDLRKMYPAATVGAISRATGISVKSCRLYLRRSGLLPPGHRRTWTPAPDDVVRAVRELANVATPSQIARRLSLTISTVRYYLGARDPKKRSHKLSPDQVAEIKRRAGTVRDRDLAIEFGVSRPTIQYHRQIAGKRGKRCATTTSGGSSVKSEPNEGND